MNELHEDFEQQLRRALPSGATDIEKKEFDYQAKILYFKYKLGRKRKKGSIQFIIKSEI